MKNTQNTSIVLLVITAVILTAMLISVYVGTGRSAYASGNVSVRQDRYIVATGGYDVNIDLLYVIDVENRTLILYAPNVNKRSIDVIGQKIALDRTFGR
jgi:hypothetical protein